MGRSSVLAASVLFLLLAGSSPARDLMAILETRDNAARVDTVIFHTPSRIDTFETPDFGGNAGIVDSFRFGPREFPMSIDIVSVVNTMRRLTFEITGPRPGQWYEFPLGFADRPAFPRIKFFDPDGIEEQPGLSVPRLGLDAAPNPFRGRVSLTCRLAPGAAARLAVLDVSGRVVRSQAVIADEDGIARVELTDLTEGVYLARMEAEGFAATGKLVAR